MAGERSKELKRARRQATPARMSSSIRADGLVMRVGVDGMDRSDATKLARKIVREQLPGKWVVDPMGNDSRDVVIRRSASEKNPTVSQAFDHSYRLSKHRDVEDCEPSLMLPVEPPDEMRDGIRHERALAQLSSSSSGGGDHLGCTDSHVWALALCSVSEAWSLPRPPGGRSRGDAILVGHPDTGYTRHDELDWVRVLENRGFDFEDGDADALDPLTGPSGGHGTSTGSVIMSGETAGPTVTGVAPLSKLIPLRVTTSVVLLSFGKLAEAIMFAADEGHHVLSISLGGPIATRFLRRAVQYATNRGVIVVAAAGNIWPFVVYPARLDEVVAVAACNCERAVWSDSAAGSSVDVTAPGESVWRALSEPNNNFTVARSSGTSYATAVTAGAAALWLAHHGRDRLIRRYGAANLPTVFKELLINAGFDRPVGWDTRNFGAGILNARKLLAARLPDRPAAGGMNALRVTTAPRTENQLDELLELFPVEAHPAVRFGLMKMFNCNESQLNVKLRDVAEEIAYHAVVDADFRRNLTSNVSGITSKRARSANARAPLHKRSRGLQPRRMSRCLKRTVTRT